MSRSASICSLCKRTTLVNRTSPIPDAHAYADDTQLYISFRADSRIDQETAVRTVEMCIEDIKRWMLTNRLKLNEAKTK